jgi:hypothetical protein
LLERILMERTKEERDARLAKFAAAITAAKEDAKTKGFKKGHGGQSSVQCPNCPDGVIRYSVASVNGHMHAGCTKGCASWME